MRRTSISILLAAAFVACEHHDGAASGSAVGGSATAGPAKPSGIAPEARARAFVQHQIDVAKNHDELAATFAPDAVVLVHGVSSIASAVASFGVGDGGPDGAPGAKVTIGKLVAGGTADVVWLYAELSSGGTRTNRVVELLAANVQWKAVAASFGAPDELQPSSSNLEIANATGADGLLTRLLGSTADLGAKLAPGAIVLGPDASQVATDASGLAAWKLDPLKLSKRAREVNQSTWGFAQGYFDHPESDPTMIDRLIAQTFAIKKPDGTWSIVLVQYRPR